VCTGNNLNNDFFPITGGTIHGTRGPFGQSFSSDGYFITIGKSSYNSAQLSVRQRIRSVEFLAGYTYSKSLDNGSGYGEQINFVRPKERSLSSFDTRHNFVVSYDYQLPFDHFGGPSRLVKGWRLSGITRFTTGLPVTLVETDGGSYLGTGGAGAIGLPIDTPDFTPGSLHKNDPRNKTVPYFNTSLFSSEFKQIDPLTIIGGTLGNSRRRFFSGPGLNNWDIALLKDTLIREGMNLEFRTELFNAFNHTQFGLPDGNITDPQVVVPGNPRLQGFGTIQTANPARIMQLSLKLLF